MTTMEVDSLAGRVVGYQDENLRIVHEIVDHLSAFFAQNPTMNLNDRL